MGSTCTNSWHINTLLAVWRKQVITNDQWKEHSYQGYHPKAVDLTAYWRPTLKNCQTKHYERRAGKAKKAVVLGIVARVGHINGQRVPLPVFFIRVDQDDPSEKLLTEKLVQEVLQTLEENEIAIFDAGPAGTHRVRFFSICVLVRNMLHKKRRHAGPRTHP